MKKLEKYLYFQLLKKTKGKQMRGNQRQMGMGYTTELPSSTWHTVLTNKIIFLEIFFKLSNSLGEYYFDETLCHKHFSRREGYEKRQAKDIWICQDK